MLVAASSLKRTLRRNSVARRQIRHASLVAAAGGGQETFALSIPSRLRRALGESELRVGLLSLCEFSSPEETLVGERVERVEKKTYA